MDEVTQESDGTFTVSFSPWAEEPIKGIPTRELAEKIVKVADEAMREYAWNMAITD